MVSAIATLARRVCFGGCAFVLAVLLLGGCASGNTVISHTTPTPTPHLKTITGVFTLPPTNCALTSPPQQMRLDHLGDNDNVQLVGGGPFWIYGSYYQSVLHLGQSTIGLTKMVVEVGPNYTQPVTIRLQDQATGALAWWTNGNQPLNISTQTLKLDPQTNLEDVGPMPGVPDVPHGAPAPGWKEWGLFPWFPSSGCYALQVSWSGGSWQSMLAVGI